MRENPGFSNQQGISRDQTSSSLYIIPKDEITPLRLIGSGNFGIVQQISWNKDGVTRICACKTLLGLNQAHKLMEELHNMIKLKDDNVVKLLGISIDGKTMSLIMEFCDGGSLNIRLEDRHKPKILVTVLKAYAYQIASGMDYLASHGVLHNDLATRNILLTDNEQRVKIGDFGLARIINNNQQYYLIRSSTPIPVAWTAPEAIKDKKYTVLSDVYSYGVVLWEMFSYDTHPKQMNHSSNENRYLKQPKACPYDIYVLMKKCWSFDSRSRPEFGEIKNILSKLKIKIMKVSTDYDGDYNGEHFYFQQGDNVIVICDMREDQIYCQNVKSHQFGIIGAEKLNSIADSTTELLYDSYVTPIQLISDSSRLIPPPGVFELDPSRSDKSTLFLNRLFGMKWRIILGIIIFCSLLSAIILAIWYKNSKTQVISTTDYKMPLYLAKESCDDEMFHQGENATIRCWFLTLSNTTRHEEIIWTKLNGMPLPSGAVSRNGKLEFTSIGFKEQSCYKCTAFNLSQNLCITVNTDTKPPENERETEGYTKGTVLVINVTNGLSTEKVPHVANYDDILWCSTPNNVPISSVNYRHRKTNNTIYENSTKPLILIDDNKGIMNFSNMQLNTILTGEYICNMTSVNGFHYVERLSAYDSLSWIPDEEEPFEIARTQIAYTGKRAILECPVFGGPILTIVWQRWEDHCFVQTNFKKDGNSLIIPKVKKEHEGFYRCVVNATLKELHEEHSISISYDVKATLTYYLQVK